ncbi:aldolase/citrate lyase family protein, partial [Nocardia sp. NPDC004722]
MRSALYVPGNRPDLFDKALAGPADVVLLDLEDAVPLGDKDSARAEIAGWLRTVPAARPRIWVRVTVEDVEADLRAVVTLFAHFPDGKESLVFDMDADREAAVVAAVR